MIVLDDSHITSAESDDLGEWTITAEVGDSSVSLSWMVTEDDVSETVDERRAALNHALDHLRVVATTDRIEANALIYSFDVVDDEIREAIRAAERIGDDDIRPILVEAWERELLCLRTPSVPAEPLTAEEELRDRAVDLIAAVDDVWSPSSLNLPRLREAADGLRKALFPSDVGKEFADPTPTGKEDKDDEDSDFASFPRPLVRVPYLVRIDDAVADALDANPDRLDPLDVPYLVADVERRIAESRHPFVAARNFLGEVVERQAAERRTVPADREAFLRQARAM